MFLALWLPIYYELAGADTKEILPPGVTHTITQDADGAGVPPGPASPGKRSVRTPTCRQWAKLGYSIEQAAGLITVWFDYEINWLLASSPPCGDRLFSILLYYRNASKEVIAEKFDSR